MPAGNTTRPTGTERVLKEEAGRGVYLVRDVDGRRVVVKRWPLGAWEGVKLVLGISQAQRQVRGARRLVAIAIPTPALRRGVRVVREGRWFTEIRLEWVEGESLLERVGRADAAEQRRLGQAMSVILDRLARGRLFHRDGKLSNFIVTPGGDIVAIDPVGVRRSRDPAGERARALAALACELDASATPRANEFLGEVRSSVALNT